MQIPGPCLRIQGLGRCNHSGHREFLSVTAPREFPGQWRMRVGTNGDTDERTVRAQRRSL
jgi:hypothetical protein